MPNEKEKRRMPFRQTIGISLALLMASAGALAKTPEQSSSYHPGPPPNAEPGKSQNRSGKMPLLPRRTQSLSMRRFPDPQRSPMLVSARPQIGQAAWYDLVGRRTSSGERLDAVTPTAAHRWLPLGSCAKVTDLDTGRSVIVRINDRGPYRHRFIIDLSPRAADQLGMRYSGVAAVAVEPVGSSGATGASEAVYRGPAADTGE
jgi:rare lipoprotein A (peptidoglycan hydrolase)